MRRGPAFTTREAMDVYIALLRSATSRRQSDEEFDANPTRVARLRADDDSYYAKMTRAYVMPHRSWLIANERRHQMRLAVGRVLRRLGRDALPGRRVGRLPA